MTFDLARALHDTVDTPAPGTRSALDLEPRLGHLATRIRRRRAVRATTQASTGLATVGAVAFVGVQGIDSLNQQEPSVVPTSEVLSMACGMPVELLGANGLLPPGTFLGVLDLTADGRVTIAYGNGGAQRPAATGGGGLSITVTEPGETAHVTLPGGLEMKLSDVGPHDRVAIAQDGVVVGVLTVSAKPFSGAPDAGVEFSNSECTEDDVDPTAPTGP